MVKLHKLPLHIKRVTSRGRVYFYFRTGKHVGGREVLNKLPPPSDPSFGRSYAGMLAARTARADLPSTKTIREVSRAYQLDQRFRKRAESTQNTYLIYLRLVEDEIGNAPVTEVERRDIRALLDKMADRPGAANMTLLVVRNLFAFAMSKDWVEADPSKGIGDAETAEREYEPWPQPLLEAALEDEAVRLPVALLYYTAQRISDVCKMRWDELRDGYLYVEQQKTGKELDILVHKDLASLLGATPRAAETILHGPSLKPARAATLRGHLQKFAADRGYKVVPHGLRKNAVNALLEAGCSTAETSAISGQSLQMVEHYAKRRNRKKLGSAAVQKWQGQTVNVENIGKHEPKTA